MAIGTPTGVSSNNASGGNPAPRIRPLTTRLVEVLISVTELARIEANARANRKVLSEARVRVVDGWARWSVTLPRARTGLLHLNAYVEGDERDAAGTRAIRLVALAARRTE